MNPARRVVGEYVFDRFYTIGVFSDRTTDECGVVKKKKKNTNITLSRLAGYFRQCNPTKIDGKKNENK